MITVRRKFAHIYLPVCNSGQTSHYFCWLVKKLAFFAGCCCKLHEKWLKRSKHAKARSQETPKEASWGLWVCKKKKAFGNIFDVKENRNLSVWADWKILHSNSADTSDFEYYRPDWRSSEISRRSFGQAQLVVVIPFELYKIFLLCLKIFFKQFGRASIFWGQKKWKHRPVTFSRGWEMLKLQPLFT